MRSLICRAIVKNACSTFDAFLAEVSRKGIPRLSANSYGTEREQELAISKQRAIQKSERSCVTEKEQAGQDAYLCHGVLDYLLVLHIALVADEQLVDALGGVTVNLLEPLLDIVERVHVGHIVHHADTVGATVVGRCDGAESFLASRVPLRYVLSAMVHPKQIRFSASKAYDLKFNGLAIKLDGPDFLRQVHQHHIAVNNPAGPKSATYEVNADSRDVAFRVGVVGKTEQEARLSNTGVPDEEKLEEVIVSITVR